MVEKVKKTSNEAWQFIKTLCGVVVAFSLLGLGVYSAYIGHSKTHLMIYALALQFAGLVNIVAGAVVLYRVLLHKEA